MNSRDDFTQSTKDLVARRVGYCCSICGARTIGPSSESGQSVSVGVAGHITAAAKGGPRFDESLSAEARKSAENAIWCCELHGKLIDSDKSAFDPATLRALKIEAEDEARRSLGRPDYQYSPRLVPELHPQPVGRSPTFVDRCVGLFLRNVGETALGVVVEAKHSLSSVVSYGGDRTNWETGEQMTHELRRFTLKSGKRIVGGDRPVCVFRIDFAASDPDPIVVQVKLMADCARPTYWHCGAARDRTHQRRVIHFSRCFANW